MRFKYFLLALFSFLVLYSCKNEVETKTTEAAGEEYKDIIRNPISGSASEEEGQKAEITFEQNSFSFDTIQEGESIEHDFAFSNTGTVSLIISNVQSTCGCTVPSWPKETIAPGEKSNIKVVFNSEGKQRNQIKPITVIANTIPNKTTISLEGFVVPKEEE